MNIVGGIKFAWRESWRTNSPRGLLTAEFKNDDDMSFIVARHRDGKWAVYFAMDDRNGNVLWSHGIDCIGVVRQTLYPKDAAMMDAAAAAWEQGLTSFEGVMAHAALDFEGQLNLNV